MTSCFVLQGTAIKISPILFWICLIKFKFVIDLNIFNHLLWPNHHCRNHALLMEPVVNWKSAQCICDDGHSDLTTLHSSPMGYYGHVNKISGCVVIVCPRQMEIIKEAKVFF